MRAAPLRPEAEAMAADPEDRTGDGPRKAVFLSALHDLERVVATHLFVISANDSGTTFLRKAPALDDLNLRQRLPVHRRYHEILTDMNARQIARLTPGRIAAINRVFRRCRAVLDRFGYEVVDRFP